MSDLSRIRFPPVAECLAATPFVESAHPEVARTAVSVAGAELDLSARARSLFQFVRDEVRYEFMAKLEPEQYRASSVLSMRAGFCVQKAVLLAALARAAQIPCVIVLSDLRDRTLPKDIVEAMGTDVMHDHGLNAFHLGGAWRLADASLSPDIVQRKRYRPVNFDGATHALLAPTTLDGMPHAEYLTFHGAFADLPFERLIADFRAAYQEADLGLLAARGFRI